MLLKLKFCFFNTTVKYFIRICLNVGRWDKGFITLSSSVRENVLITYRAESKFIFRMMTVDPAIKQSGLQPDTYNLEPTHLLFVGSCE